SGRARSPVRRPHDNSGPTPERSEGEPMIRYGPVGGAAISDCGRWRYVLWRHTGIAGVRRLTFCGLNPSTADATQDDPTIRRMLGFARREGCAMLVVVNLFAWRATSPRDLWSSRRLGIDVVGPENDAYLRDALWHPDAIPVAAWGAVPAAYAQRSLEVRDMAPPLLCLGETKHGAPRHPLYLPGDAPLVP